MYPYLRLQVAATQGTDRPARRPTSARRQASKTHGFSGDGAVTGPLVRRVLGKALIEGFCPFGEPRCQSQPTGARQRLAATELCHLATSCPYGICYAASRSPRPPFALFVAPGEGEGRRLTIELTLYGDGCAAYAWLLLALARALAAGLGRTRVRWQVRAIRRVPLEGGPILLCEGDLRLLPAALTPDHFTFAVDTYLSPQPVAVSFLSPARLLRDGKLLPGKAPVPFSLLIARALDRLLGLYPKDVVATLSPRQREQIEAEAGRVPLLADETEWIDVHDYSARSGSELLFGGKVGRLLYGPEATPFLPILRAGEILHAGKNPTSGCGRIQVEVLPPA